jgi:hypothetical protein
MALYKSNVQDKELARLRKEHLELLKSNKTLKKDYSRLKGNIPPVVLFRLIHQYHEQYSVIAMTKALGVSNAGYYKWLARIS